MGIDLELVQSTVDPYADVMNRVSDHLWEHPEVGMEEVKSAEHVASVLEDAGFDVHRGVAGLPTAIMTSYTSCAGEVSPVIGVAVEYDALAGLSQERVPFRKPRAKGAPGHGCGHNLIASAGLGAVLACKDLMQLEGLPGTVRYYGCPAEESKIGKVVMVRHGLFDDVDAIISWHPGDDTSAQPLNYNAFDSARFTFQGTSAHAAGSPHEGHSALDAVELMNVGANYLREHIMPEARLHYIIEHGGDDPNVVPHEASVLYYVRAPLRNDVTYIHDYLRDVAQGAAMMTRTNLFHQYLTGCHDLLFNRALGRRLHRYLCEAQSPDYTEWEMEFASELQASFSQRRRNEIVSRYGQRALVDQCFYDGVEPPREEASRGSGSADISEVSQVAPTAQFSTACAPLGTPGHSWQNAAVAGTTIGHKGMLYAARVIAATVMDLLTDRELLKQVKEEFARSRPDEAYVSPLDAEHWSGSPYA